jgi:hypothetical protein
MSTASLSPAGAGIRWFAALTGVTTLGVFLQAVSAGLFMANRGAKGWVTVHDIVGEVTVVAALATMIVAIVAFRRSAPVLMGASILLFVMLVAQVAIGKALDAVHGLVAVHVPLALLIFAVTIWMAVRGAVVRRGLSAA